MTQQELKTLLVQATEAMERLDAKVDRLILKVDKLEISYWNHRHGYTDSEVGVRATTPMLTNPRHGE